MIRPFFAVAIVVALGACSCSSGGPPEPNAPVADKQAHCDKVSQDQGLGCMACAGVSYCGWRMKSPPNDGTCHYVEKDKPVTDTTLVTDPQQCPRPPE